MECTEIIILPAPTGIWAGEGTFWERVIIYAGIWAGKNDLGEGGVMMKYTINVRGHLIYCILLMTVVIKIVHTSKDTC